MNSHETLMNSLVNRHSVLQQMIGQHAVHYLDIPFQGNIGDLLIMLGTLRFFEKYRTHVKQRTMYFNYSPGLIDANDVILFHGGGNFGDIYGPFQAFRERVIQSLHNHRVIILPQSIHFSNPDKLKRCVGLFSQHPDLHICVRDIESEALAKTMTPNVYLMPDMAHQLWPISRVCQPNKKLLQLYRRDSEKKQLNIELKHTFDWEDLVGKYWRFFLAEIAERSIFHAHRAGMNQPFSTIQASMWVGQAQRFVNQAITLFSQHEQIESDRLHAHILSCLLSIPHQVVDNNYGKNTRYINAWTKQSPFVSSQS